MGMSVQPSPDKKLPGVPTFPGCVSRPLGEWGQCEAGCWVAKKEGKWGTEGIGAQRKKKLGCSVFQVLRERGLGLGPLGLRKEGAGGLDPWV